jgi:hypothetical protein
MAQTAIRTRLRRREIETFAISSRIGVVGS